MFFFSSASSSPYSCAPCHSSCATCNGSAESQCITCRSGRFAHDGKCLNSCPDGYYADKKRQECVACPTGCATCTTNGFCLTCQDNWTRNKKGKCIITGSENCDECEYEFEFLRKSVCWEMERCEARGQQEEHAYIWNEYNSEVVGDGVLLSILRYIFFSCSTDHHHHHHCTKTSCKFMFTNVRVPKVYTFLVCPLGVRIL